MEWIEARDRGGRDSLSLNLRPDSGYAAQANSTKRVSSKTDDLLIVEDRCRLGMQRKGM